MEFDLLTLVGFGIGGISIWFALGLVWTLLKYIVSTTLKLITRTMWTSITFVSGAVIGGGAVVSTVDAPTNPLMFSTPAQQVEAAKPEIVEPKIVSSEKKEESNSLPLPLLGLGGGAVLFGITALRKKKEPSNDVS